MDERAGDQEPPPHSPGELVDPRAAPVDELRQLERPLDRVAPLCPGDPVEVREDEQVLLDRERDVEVVELRRDAELRPRLLRLLGQREPEQLELALVGDRLRGQQPHRRRLAGAVRAEQAHARALGHVEIEAVDGRDLAVALDDAAQPDRELGHTSTEHREDVPGGVLEPGDRRPPLLAAADNPLRVLLEALVALERDACGREPVDRLVDVLYREVEDGERRRHVVVLGIEEDVGAAAEMQRQPVHLVGDVQAEGLAVELLCTRNVVHREAGERLAVLEHFELLSSVWVAGAPTAPPSSCAALRRRRCGATCRRCTAAAAANSAPSRNAAW